MIKREDIKVGLKFCLPTAVSDKPSMVCINVELYDGKIQTLEKRNNVDFTVESVAKIFDRELCTISYCDTDGGSVIVNFLVVSLDYIMKNGEKAIKEKPKEEKAEQVSHPSHYAWLKDLCGVEPLDICRHLDFNTGNAIKYLLRKDKVDGNKTKTEKRIEDLRKAIFYIQDEINELNGRNCI